MSAPISHNEWTEFPSDKMVMVGVRDIQGLSSRWDELWRSDAQPSLDRKTILDIRIGLGEFISSHDGKPMFALWIYDREPDGRYINIAKDGSRATSIIKTYGEMFPFRRELEPDFMKDVLQFVAKIEESNGYFTEKVMKGLREKLKTGQRPLLGTTLQELIT